jgi:hypothetical protein
MPLIGIYKPNVRNINLIKLTLIYKAITRFTIMSFSPHVAEGSLFVFTISYHNLLQVKIKAKLPCNSPWRLTHFLENRLTDGGEVVSLTRLTPSKKLSRSQGHSAAGRIRSIKNTITLSRIVPATFRIVE